MDWMFEIWGKGFFYICYLLEELPAQFIFSLNFRCWFSFGFSDSYNLFLAVFGDCIKLNKFIALSIMTEIKF